MRHISQDIYKIQWIKLYIAISEYCNEYLERAIKDIKN